MKRIDKRIINSHYEKQSSKRYCKYMNAKKGIYHNGVVELNEKPETQGTSEVLVIFPEKKKIHIINL